MQTYTIKIEAFQAMQARLAKLNKRAVKCGSECLAIENPRETAIKNDSGKWVPAYQFELGGQIPRMAGFQFLATVTHTEAGNIISKAPSGRQIDLEAFRAAGWETCDHCNLKRNRNETFVILETETQITRRVGRNCLADFLRTNDPDLIVSMLAFLVELEADCADFGSDSEGDGAPGYASTDDFLAYAVAATRQWGFAKSGGENKSTKARIAYLISGPGKRALPEELADWIACQPNENDKSIALKVRAWGKEQTGSEFANNLKVACSIDYVLPKSEGLLAAAPYCFDREIAPKALGYRPFSDEWLGNRGDRLRGIRVKIVRVHRLKTQFGLAAYYTLQDTKSGCCISWKASGLPLPDQGLVTIDGTVKSHDTFKGVKQTTLTRCKAQTNEDGTFV